MVLQDGAKGQRRTRLPNASALMSSSSARWEARRFAESEATLAGPMEGGKTTGLPATL